ncbi:MAG: hypothetical protein MJ252_06170 [archaeon]|nr:hypothetical protein [archaeon]
MGYLPAEILNIVVFGEKQITCPMKKELSTVALFADISNFTKLSEKMSKKGREGPECLSFCLNLYMDRLSKEYS